MEKISQFIVEYWREIASLVALVITVIIALIRKTPKVNLSDEIEKDIASILPVFINGVEEPGNGQRKKQLVLDMVAKYVKKKFGVEISKTIVSYTENLLEGVLSTPQKKGD